MLKTIILNELSPEKKMGPLPCINTYKMAKQKWTQMASVDINIVRRFNGMSYL